MTRRWFLVVTSILLVILLACGSTLSVGIPTQDAKAAATDAVAMTRVAAFTPTITPRPVAVTAVTQVAVTAVTAIVVTVNVTVVGATQTPEPTVDLSHQCLTVWVTKTVTLSRATLPIEAVREQFSSWSVADELLDAIASRITVKDGQFKVWVPTQNLPVYGKVCPMGDNQLWNYPPELDSLLSR